MTGRREDGIVIPTVQIAESLSERLAMPYAEAVGVEPNEQGLCIGAVRLYISGPLAVQVGQSAEMTETRPKLLYGHDGKRISIMYSHERAAQPGSLGLLNEAFWLGIVTLQDEVQLRRFPTWSDRVRKRDAKHLAADAPPLKLILAPQG